MGLSICSFPAASVWTSPIALIFQFLSGHFSVQPSLFPGSSNTISSPLGLEIVKSFISSPDLALSLVVFSYMAHTFVKSPFVKIPQIITLSILFPTVTLGDTYALTPPFYLSMTGTKPAAMAFQAFI